MFNQKCPRSGMAVDPKYAIGFGRFKVGFCSKKHRDQALYVLAGVVVVAIVLL